MTENKINLKQKVAKEILIFFTGLGLIGLVWVFFFLSNLFYENKANSCLENTKSLKIKLDNLPKDYINNLYNKTNIYFVVNYKIGKSVFKITKEQEKNFLTDEFDIPKNVTRLQINPKGYSYDVFRESGDELNPKYKDSTIFFDFVSYDLFRELIKTSDYQEKFYLVFSNNKEKILNNKVDSTIDKPKFDPIKPYNGIFDIGTFSEFKSNINKGLKYNDKVIEEKNKIETEIKKQQELILSSKNNLFTNNEIKNHLIITLIVIGLFLYPIRFSIILILWAFNTIKQK